MNDSEVKARLAQAEVYFSHYRWDDAIACFETILAAHPDHPAAAQGWTNAVEQKSVDDELAQTLASVRANLAAQRFDEALTALNLAQSRGALSHILRYHSEIDGLRSEAQEGRDWQRRIATAAREAEKHASRRRYDQALETVDATLQELNARGWERLGVTLSAMRDRLWAERGVTERIHFAGSTLDRQDYRLAAELLGALIEELPEREDVRRLHERARAGWERVRDRLGAVQEALTELRPDDAVALLAGLRHEHPHNPEWQAIWLRVHMEQGRQEVTAGRSAVVEHQFEEAADAFERSVAAFTATVEVFAEHPTAAAELAEAKALREAALLAAQAVRDRVAGRWEPSRYGWQASQERLSEAAKVRGRDLSELGAVVGAMLSEASATLAGMQEVQLMLSEGQQALAEHDAARARELFRLGLARSEAVGLSAGSPGGTADTDKLKGLLSAGLREADRIQRDVRKLIGQAEGAQADQRLTLLRRAYERWRTAPGLVDRLAGELLSAASASVKAGDEAAALAYCEQIGELVEAPPGVIAEAEVLTAGLNARLAGEAALVRAAALIESAGQSSPPSAEEYGTALNVLEEASSYGQLAPELVTRLDALRTKAEERRDRALAARSCLVESDSRAALGDWQGVASALAAAQAALGAPDGDHLAPRLAQARAWAAAVVERLSAAGAAMERADSLTGSAAQGDLESVCWDELAGALESARIALRPAPDLPAIRPAAWEHAEQRFTWLARRVDALRAAREKIQAGRAVDAVPALQMHSASDPDPLVLSVLSRLLKETVGDAAMAARAWLQEATTALGRGEIAAAEAFLALGETFATAAPEVAPDLRRAERQGRALGQVRAATAAARAHVTNGEYELGLACFRQALHLAADGEAGLGVDTQQGLTLLLDLEDEIEGERGPGRAPSAGAARDQAAALVQGLLSDCSREPITGQFLAPALRGWWKLTCRAADIAFIEAQLVLGQDLAAAHAAVRLLETRPSDRAVGEICRRCAGQAAERLLRKTNRGLERARRLAAGGAYGAALAHLERLGTEQLASAHLPLSLMDALEGAIESVEDLRAELRELEELAARLTPLQTEIRECALIGDLTGASRLRSHAELLDPRRRAAAAWIELDAMAALMTLVQQEQGQAAPGHATMQRSEARGPEPHPMPVVERGAASPPAFQTGSNGAAPDSVSAPVPSTPAAELFTHDDGAALSLPAHRAIETPGRLVGGAPDPGEVAGTASPAASRDGEGAGLPPSPADEPPAPFDLDDWLNNVTELGLEDGRPVEDD
jgi:hypothetical protein